MQIVKKISFYTCLISISSTSIGFFFAMRSLFIGYENIIQEELFLEKEMIDIIYDRFEKNNYEEGFSISFKNFRDDFKNLGEKRKWISAIIAEENNKKWPYQFRKTENTIEYQGEIKTLLSIRDCIIGKRIAFKTQVHYKNMKITYSKEITKKAEEYTYRIKKTIVLSFMSFALIILAIYFYLKKQFEPISKILYELKKEGQKYPLLQKNEMIQDELHEIKNLQDNLFYVIEQSQKSSVQAERDRAIVLTTQMLAHDVQKPFTILKTCIDTISTTSSPDQVQSLLETFYKDLQIASLSVNNLLRDIIDTGREISPTFESISPGTLLYEAISKFLDSPHIEVNISLKHQHKIKADIHKIERVIFNIIQNAQQAMSKKGGKIILLSEEIFLEKRFVRFCIANNGPVIENVHRIFDTFYTHQKKNGTGLGLAIAQKMILAHEGRIECKSPGIHYPVEFYFQIPATEDIDFIYESMRNKVFIPEKKSSFVTEIKIYMLEDQEIYHHEMDDIFSSIEEQEIKFTLEHFYTSQSFLEKIQEDPPDAIISDIDIGNEETNGINICEYINKKYPQIKIAISSLHEVNISYTKYIPKPVDISDIRIFLSHIISSMKKMVLIDDQKSLISLIRNQMQHKILSFNSPLSFFEFNEKYHIKQYSYIIIDYYFDNDKRNGIQIINSINNKKIKYENIFIYSGADISLENLSPEIYFIPKNKLNWQTIFQSKNILEDLLYISHYNQKNVETQENHLEVFRTFLEFDGVFSPEEFEPIQQELLENLPYIKAEESLKEKIKENLQNFKEENMIEIITLIKKLLKIIV